MRKNMRCWETHWSTETLKILLRTRAHDHDIFFSKRNRCRSSMCPCVLNGDPPCASRESQGVSRRESPLPRHDPPCAWWESKLSDAFLRDVLSIGRVHCLCLPSAYSFGPDDSPRQTSLVSPPRAGLWWCRNQASQILLYVRAHHQFQRTHYPSRRRMHKLIRS